MLAALAYVRPTHSSKSPLLQAYRIFCCVLYSRDIYLPCTPVSSQEVLSLSMTAERIVGLVYWFR